MPWIPVMSRIIFDLSVLTVFRFPAAQSNNSIRNPGKVESARQWRCCEPAWLLAYLRHERKYRAHAQDSSRFAEPRESHGAAAWKVRAVRIAEPSQSCRGPLRTLRGAGMAPPWRQNQVSQTSKARRPCPRRGVAGRRPPHRPDLGSRAHGHRLSAWNDCEDPIPHFRRTRMGPGDV